ncbi:RNA polymerase sigma factor [Glaciecola sp. MH2013]|uniref:RNA polymerase sigma factor n=1 Tax=Glaciecola sp. MH2013 TaxID=2785524 RepID=UPI00189CB461|nr:RNA polymerase sigma factor [Glaciecola sp. MH2013]MBF7074853.1 RNA polymerase sigma factor [Glaciecola sp. MH2013]
MTKDMSVKHLCSFDEELHKPSILTFSDEQLLSQFLSGNHNSYNQLVERYKHKIFEFVYFQVKQRQDAEDLTQETFIQLFRKADLFRGDSKFSTFLYSIAKNLVFNFFRTKNRRIRLLGIFKKDADDEPAHSTLLIEHSDIDASPSLELVVTKKLTTEMLSKAISALSVDDRQLIFLADRENFSYQQISHILNIKIGTIRSRLHAIRKKLSHELRDPDDDM